MSRGITLRGEAARAFIEGAMGKPLVQPTKKGTPKRKELSAEDKYLVIATKVSMLMKSGTKADAKIACALLAQLETQGLEKTYEVARSPHV